MKLADLVRELREAVGDKGLQVFGRSKDDFGDTYDWMKGKEPLPPLRPKKRWQSAGCVVIPSLNPVDAINVYLIKPSNNYGPWSFPKGRIEPGETAKDAAVSETREETGLIVKLLPGGDLGVGQGSYSYTRYFMAVQTGGSANQHDKEVEAVRLVSFLEAHKILGRAGNARDQEILRAAWQYVRKKILRGTSAEAGQPEELG